MTQRKTFMHTKVPTKWLLNTHAHTEERTSGLARESTTNMYSYTSKQKEKKTHKIGSALVRQMIEQEAKYEVRET